MTVVLLPWDFGSPIGPVQNLKDFQDEISSWDFTKVASLAASFVGRFQRCGVLCKFVDDGARGSSGPDEMKGKLKVRRLRSGFFG